MGEIYHKQRLVGILIVFLLVFLPVQFSYASSDKELQTLRLFFEEKDLVISATRNAKPVSQTAENITIVTAKEIKAMNAHTLADVLSIIPGIQVNIRGGPGISTQSSIQGSDFRHVLVLIDGVTMNNLSDNIADIGAIPVQHIERIEIIKGPASSAWGSSLGGVINIITRSSTESYRGTLSASYGERNTGDFRFDASGKKGRLGYYLSAGSLSSDGMWSGTSLSSNNLYSKLDFDISDMSKIYLTFGYNEGSRGLGEFPEFDFLFDNSYEYWFSTLGLNAQISEESELDISLRTSRQDFDLETRQLTTGSQLAKHVANDEVNGASAKFIIRPKSHNIVIGFDVDDGTLKSDAIPAGEQSIEKRAVYINDTITTRKLSLTPGIRYDYTSTNGDFVSPSFGVTYSPTDEFMLRASIARGFNIPPLSWTSITGFFPQNPELKMEKAWSYQAGLEISVLNYIWVKATVFRHDVTDAITPTATGFVNSEKVRRQGFEVEIKTEAIYNTSFSAGFAFIDAEDRKTRQTLRNIPRYTWDIGVDYVRDTFSGSLMGHYIWWNAEAATGGKYNDFVWDLYLTQTVLESSGKEIKGFLSIHNIFNAAQYAEGFFKNPRRWVEGGLRFTY